MLEQNKQFETHKPSGLLINSGIVALAGVAMVADFLTGRRNEHSRRSETELCNNGLIDADQTVIYLAGCTQDGQDSYRAVLERTKGVNVLTPRLPDYCPSGTIDELDVCNRIISRLVETRAHKPVIIADSRGAIDAVRLIQHAHETGAAEAFGNFGKVIFNASPHDGSDITRSRNMLLDSAIMLQHFATPERIKSPIMKRAGRGSVASAPLTKIVAEGRSIRKAPAVNPIPAIIDELIYVRGPHNDPTVKSRQAAEKYRVDAPAGTFREFIDESRQPGTHIGDSGRFDLLLELAGIRQPGPGIPLLIPMHQAA